MRWIKYILAILLLVIVLVCIFYVYPKTSIITGYASKEVCSCTFISGRDLLTIDKEDTGFSPISLASSKINHQERSVSSTVFGLRKRTAYYREGYGCILDNDTNPDNNNLSSFSTPLRTLTKRDSIVWPYGSMIIDTLVPNVNYQKLETVISDVFDNVDSIPTYKTRSVLVVYKDQIIAEKYAKGFDKDSPMIGWSMTKSIINALFGILVKEGKIDINSTTQLSEWALDDRKNITYHDLLQMNSGLDWSEDYGSISDVTKMLFLSRDVSTVQLNKKLKYPIQTHFNYSSGTSNLLSGLIKRQFKNDKDYINFPYKMLFDKLGMNSMVMEKDIAGNYIASSYSFATTRDWAKFGLLYLHDGRWQDEQILPKRWTQYSATPNGTSEGVYGSHFWLNAGGIYPNVPKDLYSANGFHGQRVLIIPSEQLVIVRTGYDGLSVDQYDGFISGIISSLHH